MYSILETSGGGVIIVLSKWIFDSENKYYWPGQNYKTYLQKQISSATWKSFDFKKVLKTNIGMLIIYSKKFITRIMKHIFKVLCYLLKIR